MKIGNGLKKIFSALIIICFLFCLWLALKAGAVSKITARDGILYQDGKPCFLVGVWGDAGYIGPDIEVGEDCRGYVESVTGKKGNGLQIIFEQTDQPRGRWITTSFYPPEWAEKKYKCLKFWVKGDGSKITLIPNISHWARSKWGKTFAADLGTFSLEDAEWKKIIIPLDGKYDQLKKANGFSLVCGRTNQAFSFVIDQITATGENGEEILCDFDGHGWATSRIWSKWYGEHYLVNGESRDRFKDDPVYKALRDDPLYQEISRTNFRAIGMNTYHLAGVVECRDRESLAAVEREMRNVKSNGSVKERFGKGSFGEAVLVIPQL